MAVTFNDDILPIIFKWKAQMIWRLDLSKYEDVKANADIIYGQISTNQMPPPPFPPLTTGQIQLFQQWIADGCPE